MAATAEFREVNVGAEAAILSQDQPHPLSAARERVYDWFDSRPDHVGKLETAICITGIASFTLLKNLNLL